MDGIGEADSSPGPALTGGAQSVMISVRIGKIASDCNASLFPAAASPGDEGSERRMVKRAHDRLLFSSAANGRLVGPDRDSHPSRRSRSPSSTLGNPAQRCTVQLSFTSVLELLCLPYGFASLSIPFTFFSPLPPPLLPSILSLPPSLRP